MQSSPIYFHTSPTPTHVVVLSSIHLSWMCHASNFVPGWYDMCLFLIWPKIPAYRFYCLLTTLNTIVSVYYLVIFLHNDLQVPWPSLVQRIVPTHHHNSPPQLIFYERPMEQLKTTYSYYLVRVTGDTWTLKLLLFYLYILCQTTNEVLTCINILSASPRLPFSFSIIPCTNIHIM